MCLVDQGVMLTMPMEDGEDNYLFPSVGVKSCSASLLHVVRDCCYACVVPSVGQSQCVVYDVMDEG